MRKGKGAHNSGVSLIEVLVCLMILSLGMVAGLGMTQAGRSGFEAGRRLSVATALAQGEIEGINLKAADLLTGPLVHTRQTTDGMTLTRRIEPATPGTNLYTIRVEVLWRSGTGTDHRLAIAALRAAGVAP